MDSECSPCSELGRQIQADGLLEDSIIEIGNLHDEHYRELVREARNICRVIPLPIPQAICTVVCSVVLSVVCIVVLI